MTIHLGGGLVDPEDRKGYGQPPVESEHSGLVEMLRDIASLQKRGSADQATFNSAANALENADARVADLKNELREADARVAEATTEVDELRAQAKENRRVLAETLEAVRKVINDTHDFDDAFPQSLIDQIGFGCREH